LAVVSFGYVKILPDMERIEFDNQKEDRRSIFVGDNAREVYYIYISQRKADQVLRANFFQTISWTNENDYEWRGETNRVRVCPLRKSAGNVLILK